MMVPYEGKINRPEWMQRSHQEIQAPCARGSRFHDMFGRCRRQPKTSTAARLQNSRNKVPPNRVVRGMTVPLKLVNAARPSGLP
jgi:hypothetical protein